VPWQRDNKLCFIRVEGRLFGDVPMEIDLKLSVEDSPNSAGVAIDTIRCCKLALDRGQKGVLHSASAFFSKHPPLQMSDDEAHRPGGGIHPGRAGIVKLAGAAGDGSVCDLLI
jgi:myo-inositol-1-phosphate synthase